MPESMNFNLGLSTESAEASFNKLLNKLTSDLKKLEKQMEKAVNPREAYKQAKKGSSGYNDIKKRLKDADRGLKDMERQRQRLVSTVDKAIDKATELGTKFGKSVSEGVSKAVSELQQMKRNIETTVSLPNEGLVKGLAGKKVSRIEEVGRQDIEYRKQQQADLEKAEKERIRRVEAEEKRADAARKKRMQARQAEVDRAAQQEEKLRSQLVKKVEAGQNKLRKMAGTYGEEFADAIAKADKKLEAFKKNLQTTISLPNTGDLEGLIGGVVGGVTSDIDATQKAEKDAEKIADIWKRADSDIVSSAESAQRKLINLNSDASERIEAVVASTQTKISQIKANASGKSIAAIQAEVQAALAASKTRIAAVIAEESAKARARAENITRMNKINMAIFQTQQTIEDFQYAGLRGASNNLALMASMLEGPTGIAAMVGLVGLSIGMMVKEMKDAQDAARGIGIETKHVNTLFERQLSVLSAIRDVRSAAIDAGPEGAANRERDRLKLLEQIAQKENDILLASDQLALAKRIEEAKIEAERLHFEINAIYQTARTQPLSDSQIDRIATIKEQMKELAAERAHLDSLTIPSAAESSEVLQRLREELNVLYEVNRVRQQRASIEDEIGASLQRQQDFMEKGLTGGDGLQTEEIKERFNEIKDTWNESLKDIRRQWDSWRRKENSRLNRQIDLLETERAGLKGTDPQRQLEIEKEIIALEEKRKAITAQAEEGLGKHLQVWQAQLNIIERVAELHDEAVLAARQQSEELRKQLETSKQIIDAQNQRIENLKREKQAMAGSFEQDIFGAKSTIRDKQAQEQAEAIRKQAENARKIAQKVFHGTEGLNPVWDEIQSKRLEEALKAIDKREQALLRKVEQRRHRDQQAIQSQREAALQKRVDNLLADAEGAAALGETEKANQLLEEAKQVLGQLQGAQLSAVSQGTAAEAEQALARAKETQQKIQATIDRQIQLAEQVKEEEQARFEELKADLAEVEAKIIQMSKNSVFAESVKDARLFMQYLDQIASKLQEIKKSQAVAGSPIGSAVLDSPELPGNALGGPVASGKPTIVGEMGPELFIPGRDGAIMTSSQSVNLLRRAFGLTPSKTSSDVAVQRNETTNFGTVVMNVNAGSRMQDLLKEEAARERNRRIRQGR